MRSTMSMPLLLEELASTTARLAVLPRRLHVSLPMPIFDLLGPSGGLPIGTGDCFPRACQPLQFLYAKAACPLRLTWLGKALRRLAVP